MQVTRRKDNDDGAAAAAMGREEEIPDRKAQWQIGRAHV